MRKLLVALVVVLCSVSAFAQTAEVPADGPSAQSITTSLDGTRFNLMYLQDGQSAKPGMSMEKELPYGVRFHWATTYDTAAQEVATGPLFGYPVINTKYIDVEALVGVLQPIGSGSNRTQFTYGGSLSVDLLQVFSPSQNPNATTGRANMQLLGSYPRSIGGFGVLTTYTADDGVGSGLGWTWEVSPGIGLTPGVVVNRPDGRLNASLAAGASVRLWGDARSAVSGWGGWQYSFEGYGRPAVGLLAQTSF